uniref:Nucleolar 27S pre-rRNA processing Urb2/Npa2 C-terminal domain-containing protein n=1 Tax=Kalanchoe fedtschenkoi TaxID=63787 RepID=A0A7N0ZSW1_KALFE
MADFGGKSSDRKKKRKAGSSVENRGGEKKSRVSVKEAESADEVRAGTSHQGEGRVWRNLDMILLLQNKNIGLEKKVELAFGFVKSWERNDGDSDEAVGVSRLLLFLNDWVQSVLIPKGKGGREDGGGTMSLDVRCWVVFRFCLEEARKLSVALNFSRNLLRSVVCASDNAMALLSERFLSVGKGLVLGEELEVYNVVLDCISLVFSMHKGVLSDNLDMWLSAAYAVLQLVNKVLLDSKFLKEACDFSLRFLCLVLEPFSKYLRVHPCRKNGFQDFVDKLLEPLLNLCGLLHRRDDAGKLSEVVDEVLSQGLFHNVHIDGFLNFGSTEQYAASTEVKPKEQKTNFRSYHRHLFRKIEEIIGEKKVALFGGIGNLLHLLIQRVKIQRGASSLSKDGHLTTNNGIYNQASSSDDTSSSILSTEIRKSLFDVFAQITEPLLLNLNNYLRSDTEVGPVLLDIHKVLECISSLVSILMQENVYSRTEDTSEGVCFDYLKKVHDVVMAFSTKVTHLWLLTYKNEAWKHTVSLISEELILVVGRLLEVDYKVTGDDLVRLWSLMFSFFSFGYGTDKKASASLHSRVLSFGRQLINLYSELRQVNCVIVSLCEAMRSLGPHHYGDDISSSLQCKLYSRSVRKLIGSEAFRTAICNAIKSIPEGQAGGCIQQLAEDMSDSVEWIKASCSAAAREDCEKLTSTEFSAGYVRLHLEVFGLGISEIYSLVLESVSITAGNSNLVGTSIEEIMAVMRPAISTFVAQQPNLLDFFVSFTGAMPNNKTIGSEYHLLGSAHLILLFFFHLYLSCRSSYRQAICLVAPKTAKKMSKLMGDSISAYSGRELLEMNDWTYEGYFSWILQPSASLPAIIKFIQHNLLRDCVNATPALAYVLHLMAIHRLVDLNRRLKTFEYLQQTTNYGGHARLNDEADLASDSNLSSLEKNMSLLRHEALELVDILMGQLFLVTEERDTMKDAVSEVTPSKDWDLIIGFLSNKSLPTAIWRVLCQNIDTWSTHAAKKQLKVFLTKLIHTALPQSSELHCPEKITIQKISLELLGSTVFYEQKSIRRHLASRLGRVLKKLMLTLPSSSRNGYHKFSSSASAEILASLDIYLATVLCKKNEISSLTEQKSKVLNCQGLLNLLCWMPLGYLNRKSFFSLATAVLDLERLLIANMSEMRVAPSEWLSLLVACRRALKNIVLVACEDVQAASPFFLMTPDNSVATSWLLKTLSSVSELSHVFSKDGVSKMRDDIFTLMDLTSNIFMNLCKNQVHHVLVSRNGLSEAALDLDIAHKIHRLGDNDPWRGLITMAETLKEETGKFNISVSGINDNEAGGGLGGMRNLSCYLSCVHGFLWGVASALTANTSSVKPYEFKLEKETAAQVNVLPSMFTDFLDKSLRYLLYKHSQWPGLICPTEIELDNGVLKSANIQQETSEASNLKTDGFHAACIPFDMLQPRHFDKSVLHSLLKGDHPEAAFLLRQLLLAASAGIRLNKHVSTLSGSAPLFTSISQILLSELADVVEAPPPFSFVWFDGVLKYLEELGNHFPVIKSTPTINDSYIKLMALLMRVNGKCISFQGKRATLASHETESTTKMLDNQTEVPKTQHLLNPNTWDEFKSRIRTSFIGFIGKASEQHLLSAIQAIDRALVGVQEGSTMIYEVVTGSAAGGRVSANVAAGVDCLDLVLEHASGRKRLGVVQRHIQRLVAGLFNITWHLRSPCIFTQLSYTKEDRAELDPDPGSVALMCTEVLIRIFAKQALFRLDYCHVGQALRLPGALFQNFLHINPALVRFTYDDAKKAEGINGCNNPSGAVDRKFSIDLYAASCRLLSTVIKHHKEECVQSIAVLEDSVSVLLNCLETVNSDLETNGYFWRVQEGVRCACFLRRVYEELRQQKDVFGQRIFLFLSHYIWVYSGYGPNQTGIKREIDEALKPGIYALIDACSAVDLQYLHTVFGEGPCRSTLARLQQDYESNFRYVGKV